MPKLEPSDLKPVTGMPQALDNQWRPRGAKEQASATAETPRDDLVREEFIRALIALESVVVNRASLVNASALRPYFDPGHPEREHLAALFRDKALIPFLSRENDALIDPDALGFSANAEQARAWNDFQRDAGDLPLLRLSWNDAENDQLLRERLGQAFHHRILVMSAPTDMSALAMALNLGEDAVDTLRRTLTQVAAACLAEYGNHGHYTQREFIYRKFVVEDDSPPHLGRIDERKPFSRAIKECADLIYNTNLPDALDRYLLTPAGSPSRSMLQEFDRDLKRGNALDPERAFHLLRATTFSRLHEGLCIAGYGALGLGEVRALRDTEQWRNYIASHSRTLDVRTLCENTMILDDVFRHYVEVITEATTMLDRKRRGQLVTRWRPMVQIVLEAAGRPVISTIFDGNEAYYTVAEAVLPYLTDLATPTVIKMCVLGYDSLNGGSPHQRKLDNNIVLMTGNMSRARTEINNMVRRFKSEGVFSDARTELVKRLSACRENR